LTNFGASCTFNYDNGQFDKCCGASTLDPANPERGAVGTARGIGLRALGADKLEAQQDYVHHNFTAQAFELDHVGCWHLLPQMTRAAVTRAAARSVFCQV
jgi:hypothetical protein